MPVMVEDYINGSFCHRYIGVNGEAARLPELTKDTFLDSVVVFFSFSLCTQNMHACIQYICKVAHTHKNIHTNKEPNMCCLFALNCSFARLSSDVHFVIVKSTSVATSFEVECGSFVQGQTHT